MPGPSSNAISCASRKSIELLQRQFALKFSNFSHNLTELTQMSTFITWKWRNQTKLHNKFPMLMPLLVNLSKKLQQTPLQLTLLNRWCRHLLCKSWLSKISKRWSCRYSEKTKATSTCSLRWTKWSTQADSVSTKFVRKGSRPSSRKRIFGMSYDEHSYQCVYITQQHRPPLSFLSSQPTVQFVRKRPPW